MALHQAPHEAPHQDRSNPGITRLKQQRRKPCIVCRKPMVTYPFRPNMPIPSIFDLASANVRREKAGLQVQQSLALLRGCQSPLTRF